MPDAQSRSWIVRLAKLFQQQLSADDIATHARRIGISNSNKLLNCVENRGTHTVREIVRLICPEETLLTKFGKESVSEERRQAIRGQYYLIKKLFSIKPQDTTYSTYFFSLLDFVELQNEPIPDHQFNEAIDRVFCHEKQKMRKAQISIEKNQNSNRQQLIDALYMKKSISNIQQTDKEVAVVTTSDLDEHF